MTFPHPGTADYCTCEGSVWDFDHASKTAICERCHRKVSEASLIQRNADVRRAETAKFFKPTDGMKGVTPTDYADSGRQDELPTGGRKDDQGKLRIDLIPVSPFLETAKVFTVGAEKYGDRNWEKGMSFCRCFAAMQRHAWAWMHGETRDLVDGQHHLSSVAFYALALMELEETHPEFDDRPKKES